MNLQILQLLCSWTLSGVLRFIPLSYIWGSSSAFLTLYQGAMPVSFTYGLFSSSFLTMVIHCFFARSISWIIVLKGLPTLTAGLYIYGAEKYESSRWFSAAIMLIFQLCLFGFKWCIPVSSIDYVYVIPWIIIPVAYHFSFFWRALGALYLAQAVGTVIYMFCGSLLPSGTYALLFWQSLFERLILTITAVAVKNFVSVLSLYIWNNGYKFKKSFLK